MEPAPKAAAIIPVSASPAPARIADGARLGDYVVEREALSDRLFLKFFANHASLGTQVFVKVVRPGIAVDQHAFEALVRRLESLGHPSVVPIVDGGCEGQFCYVVEPLVDGFSFHEGLRVDHFMEEDKPKVLRDIAEGLSALHAEGIVHGDLKTDTVFVSADDVALVAGYGFSALVDRHGQAPPRLDQALRRFCAPEVLGGKAPDVRADVYSLAAVSACLLMGRERWERSDAALAGAVLKPSVKACLLRGMAKRPEDRPASAAAFSEELTAALASSEAAVADSAPKAASSAKIVVPAATDAPAAKPSGGGRKKLVLVASVVAVLSAGGIAAVMFVPRDTQATGAAPAPVAAEPAAAPSTTAEAAISAIAEAPAKPAFVPPPTPAGPGYGNAWLQHVSSWPGHFRVSISMPGVVPWTQKAIVVCDNGDKATRDALDPIYAAAEKEGLLANVVRILDRPGDPVPIAQKYKIVNLPQVLFADETGKVHASFSPPFNEKDFIAKLKEFVAAAPAPPPQ